MSVTQPNEALSTSSEEHVLNASRDSKIVQNRESVRNVFIGDDEFRAGAPKDRDVTFSEFRSLCQARYDALYPSDKLVDALGEEERYPAKNSLYNKMGLSEESAKRISRFENDRIRHWYVFRLNYGLGLKDIENLDIPDCTIYIPELRKQIKRKGKSVVVRDIFMRNFFFAFTTRRIAEIIHESPRLSTIRIYYNHFQKDEITGYDTPLTLPHSQMMDFMLIAEAKSFDTKVLDPNVVATKEGDNPYVEVTDGPFKGVRGNLMRVCGKQRVVCKNGLCVIATGYISSYGYKVLSQKEK